MKMLYAFSAAVPVNGSAPCHAANGSAQEALDIERLIAAA
jgi:hypothetical protein